MQILKTPGSAPALGLKLKTFLHRYLFLFNVYLIMRQQGFWKIHTFEKIYNFSEKKPTEGLELMILLHTQVLSFGAS